MKTLASIVLAVLLVAAVRADEPRKLSQPEILEYLQQISAAQRANREKLKAWTGVYEITLRMREETPIRILKKLQLTDKYWYVTQKFRLSFVTDLTKNRQRTKLQPELDQYESLGGEFLTARSRLEPAQLRENFYCCLRTSTDFLTFQPNAILGLRTQQSMLPAMFVRGRRIERFGPDHSDSFVSPDPREFSGAHYGARLHQFLEGFAEWIRKEEIELPVVIEGTEDAGIFTLKFTSGTGDTEEQIRQNPQTINTLKFDKANDYQLVETEVIDLAGNKNNADPARVDQRNVIQVQYLQRDGIWLPKLYDERTVDRMGIVLQSTRKLIESQVNQPVMESDYTMAALGAMEGDLYQDHEQKQTFVIDRNLQLVKPDAFEPTEAAKQRLEAGAKPR